MMKKERTKFMTDVRRIEFEFQLFLKKYLVLTQDSDK